MEKINTTALARYMVANSFEALKFERDGTMFLEFEQCVCASLPGLLPEGVTSKLVSYANPMREKHQIFCQPEDRVQVVDDLHTAWKKYRVMLEPIFINTCVEGWEEKLTNLWVDTHISFTAAATIRAFAQAHDCVTVYLNGVSENGTRYSVKDGEVLLHRPFCTMLAISPITGDVRTVESS